MPGMKRRIDEDMWFAQQLKKSKFSDENVYASTLAKLRQGARMVFGTKEQQEAASTSMLTSSNEIVPQMIENLNNESINHGNTAETETDADGDDSIMELDMLAENESIADADDEISFCEDCDRNRQVGFNPTINLSPGFNIPAISTGHDPVPVQIFPHQLNQINQTERCSFCEKRVCHLNFCKNCRNGFCGSCCISRYDEPHIDSFICVSCLCEIGNS